MSMRNNSKATSWRYDGVKGKRYNKQYANTYERRQGKQIIEEEIYSEYQ